MREKIRLEVNKCVLELKKTAKIEILLAKDVK